MGRLRRRSTGKSQDLSTLEGLAAFASEQGFDSQLRDILTPEPKLSFLQRISKGLGAFNPAEAILTGQEQGNVGAGIAEYGKNILQGVGSAITGKDLEGERRTFSDVAEKLGVENRIARFGIGILGDVLLDPSTYFGGALARGLIAGTKVAGKVGVKAVGRVSPEFEQGVELATQGLRDAFGRAFVYGYRTSEGAAQDVLTFMSKRDKAKLGLAASNLDRLGTGVLTKTQQEELAINLIRGKRAEFTVRDIERGVFTASQREGVQNLQKTIRGVERDVSRKFRLEDIPGISGIRAARLKASGFGVEKFLRGNETGFFEGDIFVQNSERLAKILGISKENAGRIIDEANVLFDSHLRSVSGSQELLREYTAKLRELQNKVFQPSKLPGRVGTKTAFEGIKDPTVRQVAEEQLTRSQKIGEQLGLENPYEVYFPFLKKDKIEGFLKQTSGLRVGSEGYRKQFKNLLTNENLELDPAKAFFTREAQIVTDRMSRDFLYNFTKRYGRPLDSFASSDEAMAAGFQLIKDKGLFGKAVGYVNKYDANLLTDSLSPEFQTLNMLAKASGFDAVTSLFKRSVTGLFVPFHIRNFASGLIQNYEVLGKDVLNPQNIAAGQKIAYLMGSGKALPKAEQVMQIAGQSVKARDVFKPFMDRFSGDTFYTADFLDALKNGGALKSAQKTFSKETLKETVKTAGVGSHSLPFKSARAVGQYIEHQQKATAYVTALNQGRTIPEALKLAEAAGFDYRALTRFESQILRRIIPFYSFTRKNISLQLKTLGENPQRINQVLKFFENTPELFAAEPLTAEEENALPDYLRESVLVKLPDTDDGLKQYISSFGTPIEAFAQMLGKNPLLRAVSQTNPILKVPLELAFGKDSFRQRDIKEVYTANEYKMAPQFVKDFLEIQPVEKDVLEKNRAGKLVKVGSRTQYVANPEKLLVARAMFTSRGVTYLDQVFGNDLEGVVKLIKTTTGIKPQGYDISALQGIKESKMKRDIEDLLVRYGDLRQFRTVYVPKNRLAQNDTE